MIRFAIYAMAIAGGVVLTMGYKNGTIKHIVKGITGGELWKNT